MNVTEMFRLDGKVALVTGGSRGLGFEMAEGLAEAGASVLITGRRARWLDEAMASFSARNLPVIPVEADVAVQEDVDRVLARAAAEFGGLDILVNNAGITWGAPTLEYPIEKWEQILHVNLSGTWMMTRAAAPLMIQRGAGRIINLSSFTAQVGMVPEVQEAVAYQASKGGIDALTRDLAVKWARHGITVNAIAPGYFHTRMTEHLVDTIPDALNNLSPMKRTGSSGELKGVAVFLASAASSFITGQVINVDGGASIF